ncbi:heparan-alpha-glucosaminide N-acetyltransferase domain-containing protein [Brachybacterium phenoliresistens]|uniref:heparan-alpha-glucosaminide N-acetyltransferase domain-containing protein n=1 Tax=Brachybacterium phenoliresistens TaxID=396014 RepID=UPI0031CE0B5F
MTSRTPARPFHAPRPALERTAVLPRLLPATARPAPWGPSASTAAPRRRDLPAGTAGREIADGGAGSGGVAIRGTGDVAAGAKAAAEQGGADRGSGGGIGRLESLDLVRLLAILGMMAAHLLAPLAMVGADGLQGATARVASVLTEGPASATFAVVGGFSLVLASRGRLLAGDRRGAVLAGVLRGALVAGIGLVLGFVPTSVVVVLVPFGIGMMITAPLLLVRSRWLIAIAAVLTAGGGYLNALVRSSLGQVQEVGAITPLNLAEPVVLLRGLALTGMYPLVTWLSYLLLGVVLMRSLLTAIEDGRARRWSARALGIAAAVATATYGLSALAGAWAIGHGVDPLAVSLHGFGAPVLPEAWALAVAAPHSGSPADMIATASVAVALIGAMTLLVPPGRHLREAIGRTLRTAGAAPLTIYTVHVILTGVALVVAMLSDPEGGFLTMPWYVAGLGVFAVHVSIALGIGAALARSGRRGPLEAALSGAVRRGVPQR